MKQNTRALIRRFINDEQGIQHAEEALLLGLIAVVSIVVVTSLGQEIERVFTEGDTALKTVP
ncbi:MAG: Flp family type IVb pilin [Chloroflexi bacterium]|nr:Flp family type IVb pilin [Chloroflexota bacterium]